MFSVCGRPVDSNKNPMNTILFQLRPTACTLVKQNHVFLRKRDFVLESNKCCFRPMCKAERCELLLTVKRTASRGRECLLF